MERQTDNLMQEIAGSSSFIRDPAGRTVAVINDFDTLLLAGRHGCAPRRIHLAALEQDIWPLRYVRNFESLTPADQKKLLETRVAVIGAGGLGGHVLELLARTGIGTLVSADPDTFDETNLNRQAMARTDTLNEFKTDAAAAMLFRINPAIDIVTHKVRIAPDNIDAILDGSHIAVDALDNAKDRLILHEACFRRSIPLIHGTLAGFDGRVMTIYPGDPGMRVLYGGDGGKDETPAELRLGVPAIAPAFIASLQAMEVLKIVLARGRLLRNRMLYADLENGRFEEYRLE